MNKQDWHCDRIAAPWASDTPGTDTECLFRKEFDVKPFIHAELTITAQGVYEAEINGRRVGDHFMAPGWTSYDRRLQYQTYDVTAMLSSGRNCIGVRVAEGWFCGRIGFEGGHRNIWGPHPALMAKLKVHYAENTVQIIPTDTTWVVQRGPIRLAEIYNGEKYDATQEVQHWSTIAPDGVIDLCETWMPALCMPPLPEKVELTAGFGEPVRRIEIINPIQQLVSPTGKLVLDFGQNLVGYVRLRNIRGPRGHKIIVSHAEVLENQELCTRPLRQCDAVDEYILKGDPTGENYEPRFTFHGFRYAQIDGWTSDFTLIDSVEAIVCHSDMAEVGSFACSDKLINQLYQNIRWGMKGNFLSVPSDCPQRDERLGWSGDLALFAPTAVLLFDCYDFLKNWLVDVWYDQQTLNGVPAMVTPNATLPDPIWCRRKPCAIWHDVTILAPWALYEETGKIEILEQQYESMTTWMQKLPRNKEGLTHLWDISIFQLGDWLDPDAPPNAPWKGKTDAQLVANAFLIHSLELMTKITNLLQKSEEKWKFEKECKATKKEFQEEYVTSNGRLVSDSQAAYAIAICFGLLTPAQQERAGNRLVYLVRKNNFQIGTGFAGTPFLCEALALTGHINVAYAMLLEKSCPSWLYPVTMGATTVWERWDSMLPDGSINPGEMTSFNHYAFGSIAKFLYERLAGLQRIEPGWKKCRIAPRIGAEFSEASASHESPLGLVSCSWKIIDSYEKQSHFEVKVTVPPGMTCVIVLPEGSGEREKTVGQGEWTFETDFTRDYEWPVQPLPPKS
ncbi:alfa-L-rhamnosidase [Penicillium brasilianum]|uniref:alpha-L-rhamnosidase n=1 Tax=Penicillium brasilianum TaxID=104259 RepID=A0A1S9RQN1_PENBI|nr:alfa-L-rhamnosidase [Penicillium brasilianum]